VSSGRPVFVVEQAGTVGDVVTLRGAEGRHAVVRRVHVGEEVELVDGRGSRLVGTVVGADGAGIDVSIGSASIEPALSPRLVVVQALAKGDRSEWAVEMLTEVGVDVIVPWAAARSVTVWRGDRAEKGLRRWGTTAREAAKQSRRSRFVDVRPLATTAAVASLLGEAGLGVVLHESAEVPLSSVAVPPSGDIVLVVGPEGGVDPSELAIFADAGAAVARLGPTVLRTSTAGVVGAAALLSRTSRWA
jgi:16S rRNA (uracil1498-N3)-methyltransferase